MGNTYNVLVGLVIRFVIGMFLTAWQRRDDSPSQITLSRLVVWDVAVGVHKFIGSDAFHGDNVLMWAWLTGISA